MVHVGVSACGFMDKNMTLAQKLKARKGATVIDYSDKYYELN